MSGWLVEVWCVPSATHVSCIWSQKKVLSISACVLNIRVSLWCVNSNFKELFVLKVTFKVICLNSFGTCLSLWFDIWKSWVYSFIFSSISFYRDICHFLFGSKFIGVAHRQIVHIVNYINAASLCSLGSDKLYMPVSVSRLSEDVSSLSSSVFMLANDLRALRKISLLS